MALFSPNHGALLPKPRGRFSPNHGAASPQTTGPLLPKPCQTQRPLPLCSGAITAEQSGAPRRTASVASTCDGWRRVYAVEMAHAASLEGPHEAWSGALHGRVHAASDDDGVETGARERRGGGTAGDTPHGRDPASARDAPPRVGGPRVAARPLLASAVQEKDGRGNNCIIAARRLT
jgi:hypothetical protein